MSPTEGYAGPFQREKRRITVGDAELAVVEVGAGGLPVFLVHGFTGSSEDFFDYPDRLAGLGYHVVIPDLRGHGESDKPADESCYNLDWFAADVVGLADHLGWDRFDLLGHSMGGMAAQVVAIDHESRLRSLVLLDTHHGGAQPAEPQLVELGVAMARKEGMGPIADVMADLGDDAPLSSAPDLAFRRRRPDFQDMRDRRLRLASPEMYAAMLSAFATLPDRLDALARLDLPTLVMVGSDDTPFLRASQRMTDAIPGARQAVIPDAGHSPQLESPDAWWDALTGFLAEVGSKP